MGRRRELRLHLALAVRVWGRDISGRPFEQDATTVDLTRTGVRLQGIRYLIEPGSVVQMQHRDSKARFRVRWAGKPQSKDHIGMELLKGEKFDWGRSIPIIPGDSFVNKLEEDDQDFKYLK